MRVGVELKGFRGLGRAYENFFIIIRITKQKYHYYDQYIELTFDKTSTYLGNKLSLEYRYKTYCLFAIEKNLLRSREKIFVFILLNFLSTELPVWFHGTNI
jgi:hypothetical protein